MLYSEFLKKYPAALLEKEELKIIDEQFEVSIDLKLIYKEYKVTKNFKFENYVKLFIKEIDKNRFKIDYNKVYPFIRPIGFGKNKNENLLRENLFLNLEILYAADMGDHFRFINQSDSKNLKIIKESSMKNLKKNYLGIEKIDKTLEIYTIPIMNVYSSSYFLLEDMKKEIENKIGPNYLFAIPYSSTVLVCKNNLGYIKVLQDIMNFNPNTEKVSNNVYKYVNGNYDYAEKREIFKIIK